MRLLNLGLPKTKGSTAQFSLLGEYRQLMASRRSPRVYLLPMRSKNLAVNHPSPTPEARANRLGELRLAVSPKLAVLCVPPIITSRAARKTLTINAIASALPSSKPTV